MKSIRTLLLFLVMATFAAVSAQQTVQPVRWRAIVKTDASGSGTLTVKAIVATGWHLYALNLPDGGPKPTTFSLAGSKNIEFKGSLEPVRDAVEVDDPLFGMKLAWWDSNIEFTVPFKVTGPDASFRCEVNYMACDGQSCRPPSTEVLAGAVKIQK